MPVRFEYFALQTRDGWYVLPKLGDTGNRYSSLFVQAERAGGGLVLRYKYDLATAGGSRAPSSTGRARERDTRHAAGPGRRTIAA
jgi:hypothetical protein